MRKEQREGTQTHYIPILTARPGLSAVLKEWLLPFLVVFLTPIYSAQSHRILK